MKPPLKRDQLVAGRNAGHSKRVGHTFGFGSADFIDIPSRQSGVRKRFMHTQNV